MHGPVDRAFLDAAHREHARRRAAPAAAPHGNGRGHPPEPPDPPSTDEHAAVHWKAGDHDREQAAHAYLTRL